MLNNQYYRDLQEAVDGVSNKRRAFITILYLVYYR